MLWVGVVPPTPIACTSTNPNPDASLAALSVNGTKTVAPLGMNTVLGISDVTPFGMMLVAPV